MADRGPLCVGIDPHAALLPTGASTDDVAGLERFALTVVEAVGAVRLGGQAAVGVLRALRQPRASPSSSG